MYTKENGWESLFSFYFIRKGKAMGTYLLISDAAKEVKVESHVLRYWEEELRLPIKRNELGHRYYTQEDVERFKQIKMMKERGLQLKAIKMILKDGKLDVLSEDSGQKKMTNGEADREGDHELPIDVISVRDVQAAELSDKRSRAAVPDAGEYRGQNAVQQTESREDKARRLQWLLQQLIRETLRENNEELCRNIKESMIKELDYQFRNQEEREEERDRQSQQRSEEYYKRMDELLRKKSSRKSKKQREKEQSAEQPETVQKADKKKRHFVF